MMQQEVGTTYDRCNGLPTLCSPCPTIAISRPKLRPEWQCNEAVIGQSKLPNLQGKNQ